jgi:hypothetical protein
MTLSFNLFSRSKVKDSVSVGLVFLHTNFKLSVAEAIAVLKNHKVVELNFFSLELLECQVSQSSMRLPSVVFQSKVNYEG